MKKFIALMLALMLFIAVLPTSAFADSSKKVYVSRNGGKIYLHTGPGYEYSHPYTVKHNAKVTVKDTSGSWSKVKVSSTGKTGWIRTMYIDGTTKKLGKGYKDLNISSGGSVSLYTSWKATSVKATLHKGDTVRVNGTEHDYAKVVVTGSGDVGWIQIKYIGSTVDPKPVPPSSDTVVYRTTASTLNMRSGPGTKYSIVGKLPYGTGCTLIKSSGNWRKVKTFSGKVGWVSRTYLSRSKTAHVATNGGNLNVRSGPGTYAYILGSLKNGTKVTIKHTNGNWAYVTAGKLTGYVSLHYLAY